jgi:hypothetical protein
MYFFPSTGKREGERKKKRRRRRRTREPVSTLSLDLPSLSDYLEAKSRK